MEELRRKELLLEDILRDMGSAAAAFSAGVDSSFLAFKAHEVLGGRMAAVTVDMTSFPRRELAESGAFCDSFGIRHIICGLDQLSVSGFAENPPDRCYHCKRAVFTVIRKAAADSGLSCVIEGSNADDISDYRPGLKAIAELGIRSPLREAELTKSDIRTLSEAHGLPTWDKPSFACLATRIPYGDKITHEKLMMIESAEQRLSELGFTQYRVRVHGDIARIELPREDFPLVLRNGLCDEIISYFSQLGFAFTALDLGGYKTGSMNRTLFAQKDRNG